ncbi:MAG TPA: FAD:protein FMN transferase [Propionibacteriaceae bacterium]
MNTEGAAVGRRSFAAIGTINHVLSAQADRVEAAAVIVRQQLAELDATCSRFRADSELSALARGREVAISPLLTELLAAGIRTARRTNGLVDPTVGAAMRRLGYDDDLATIRVRPARSEPLDYQPAPGFWRIALDQSAHRVMIPYGVEVDLGASAKAWAADRAARTCHEQLGGGFLVNLGGDLAVAGRPPQGGWQVSVDDATELDRDDWPIVTVRSGGLATSSTAVRTWRHGDRELHHIIDPHTGDVADPWWRAVTVVAETAELANAAATAAVVLGPEAAHWLARRRLPARLVSQAGLPVYVGEWPEDVSVRSRAAGSLGDQSRTAQLRASA